ncbi:hypothetical protein AAK967_01695 [Atopobiaceae bacterium 24-176]
MAQNPSRRGRATAVKALAVAAALCALCLPVGLSACSSGHGAASGATTTLGKTQKVAHGRKPDSDELLVIRTDDSTSAYGKAMQVKASADGSKVPVTLVTEFFSSSRFLFIYVDDAMVEVQETPKDRTVIQLSGDRLEPGTHTIEAVQYAGDSPAATVTMYKTAQYVVS